ncbi:MAG TPA: neutral zinc metallopeptidase [Gemmatimonadales bacterium]
MRWQRGHRSQNVEDRRRSPVARGAGIGLGGLAIMAVISLLMGQNPVTVLMQLLGAATQGGGVTASAPITEAELAAQEESYSFVSFILDDTQKTWREILPTAGASYQDARLVVFRDATESACGLGQSAMGPFYCPGDQQVYIDLAFYDDLKERFGAPGDFAQAYVIAHEIGHHVQNILGVEQQMREAQRRNPSQANELSVLLELQADCLAGVWGHSAAQRGLLEAGDLEEGLNAAAAIGDDRIQKQQSGRVSPESFTHGSSAQRVQWLRRGLEAGRVDACDTFK